MSAQTQHDNGAGAASASDRLLVIDSRTGKEYEIPIEDGTIRATALRKVKLSDDDLGLLSYDPAYMATASCRSAITFIDGETGILEYRGYPIEQLAEQSTHLEVAHLLIHGHLPKPHELEVWTDQITHHTFVHENIKRFMQGFRYDAHPMGMLLASVGASSTFYPEAHAVKDPDVRYAQVVRLIAKMPTLAAFAYRHNRGMPYVCPDNDLSYVGNFLSMLYKMSEQKYEPDPRLEHALDVLFILPPTTSRTARPARCGASAHRRSIPTRPWPPGWRRSTVRCTGAPTSRCCGCCAGSRPRRTSPTSSRGSRTAKSA
jgi:citrate synthase